MFFVVPPLLYKLHLLHPCDLVNNFSINLKLSHTYRIAENIIAY